MSKSNRKKADEVINIAVKKHVLGGQTVSEIPMDRIDPNPWNPNRMNEDIFKKELASITEFGMVAPVLVRYKGKGRWEIVDGEHRYKACKELGYTHLLCVDLGDLSDQKAKKLTIIANDLRGKSDPNDLAKLIADLAEQENPEELAKLLPQSQIELESIIASLQPYDHVTDGVITAPDTSSLGDAAAPPSTLAGLGKDIRMQFGPLKGTIAEPIFRELMEEWTNSVQHIGTKNLELVVKDLVQRLQSTRRPAKAAETHKAAKDA